jgi:23S rRNA pseudouridine1911/1915/1917 synthase
VVTIPEDLRVPLAERALGTEALGEALLGELQVLYRDECALAVDKPPLLPVHPSGRHLQGTLIQRLHALMGTDQLAREQRPRLCHRLDRETSGIVLVGLDPWSHAKIMRQFERRQVEKEYLAVVRGRPADDGGRISLPLGPARGSKIGLKIMVDPERGIDAATEWRVVERFRWVTLVACKLLTGRQHQIRVHMQSIGHPLVGDKLYGPSEMLFQRAADGTLSERDRELLELERHALHSHRLSFTSPRSGRRVEVVSPLARDLQAYLDRQRR